MDSYAIHQQRPLTPPNDRNKDQHVNLQDKGANPSFQRHGEETSLNDTSYLSKEKASGNAMPPVSTAPSAPSATAASVTDQGYYPKGSILSDIPKSTNHAPSAPRATDASVTHQDHAKGSVFSDNLTQSTNHAPNAPRATDAGVTHQDYAKDSIFSDNPTQSSKHAPSAPRATDSGITHRDYAKGSILSDNLTQSTNHAPSAPRASAASVSHQDHPILNDISTQSANRAHKSDNPFNDVRAYVPSTSAPSTKYGSSDRNDTTQRIESEIFNILKWKNPVRSGCIFALVVGSIIMTRWYSLVQIGSSLLTLAIGVNLIYVNFLVLGQKLVTSSSPDQQVSHPYNNVIHNDKHNMLDKQSVRHYSTVLTEVSETMIRALTRIVFVEDTATSIKWMSIFFVIWKVSAHVSTMDIVLAVVISAFIVPRFYNSNKDVVDAQLQKGQTLIQTGFEKAQTAATTAVHDTCTKSRVALARAGTTGTDAKNTLSKESVTVKQD